MRKLMIFLICFFVSTFAWGQEAATIGDGRLFRIGSEIFYEKDIQPSQKVIDTWMPHSTPEEINRWLETVRADPHMISSVINEKLQEAFCEEANCVPTQDVVEKWNIFMKMAVPNYEQADENARTRVESLFGGGPELWQVNKALYDRFGGKFSPKGNLGYYFPIEAYLRLFEQMEKENNLEFYDSDLRDRVVANFNQRMETAIDADELFKQKEKMINPWEYPFWDTERQLRDMFPQK